MVVMTPNVSAPRVPEVVNILITGGGGQVGIELLKADWPGYVVLHAPDRSELDITVAASIERILSSGTFDAVINPAAYTAVDKAEDEIGEAFAANAVGPALLAAQTSARGIPLIHVSTDYVFDGEKDGFYSEEDPVGPVGVYGISKLAGEFAVRSGNPRSVVLRTAWVFSSHRNNFVKTMLRLGTTHPSIRVVSDQIGCPTGASDIASALATITLRLIEDEGAPTGVYHFVNAGEASWYDLAKAVFKDQPAEDRPEIVAIETSDYPTRARRPANSRLNTTKLKKNFGIKPRNWEAVVKDVVLEIRQRNIS